MARRSTKPTKEESKAAFDAQDVLKRPSGILHSAKKNTAFDDMVPASVPAKRGRKPGSKVASPMRVKSSSLSFADLKRKMREITPSQYDDQETNWLHASDYVGVPFSITRAWSFESAHGSKVGFKIIDEEGVEGIITLSWNKNRDALVESIRALLRGSKGASVDGMTFKAIDVGQPNPYYELAPFRE